MCQTKLGQAAFRSFPVPPELNQRGEGRGCQHWKRHGLDIDPGLGGLEKTRDALSPTPTAHREDEGWSGIEPIPAGSPLRRDLRGR